MARANVLVRPPRRPSDGAVTIRRALGDAARLSRLDPVPRQYKSVINWGNASNLSLRNPQGRVFNKPEAVANATNKLQAFDIFRASGVSAPESRTELSGDYGGSKWLARTCLSSSGGEGIVVVRPDDTVPEARLYVRYVPKSEEYRLHVVNGRTIFAQQKRKKSNTEQTPDQKLIRNYANGWVFCPVEVSSLREEQQAEAVNAVAALGLDFGAVDCIVGRDNGKFYVLEVNTAPGLESPGLIAAYTQAFKEMIDA